jgi:hypothetical protein
MESNADQRVADSHDRDSGEGIRFSLCAAPLYKPIPQISEAEDSQGKSNSRLRGQLKTIEEEN